MTKLVDAFCSRADLTCNDPYDVWQTTAGQHIKRLFYRHRAIGSCPAALVSVLDLFLSRWAHKFYIRREYPIVRAIAALALLNLYRVFPEERYLSSARRHLVWLENHPCRPGLYAWGLPFDHVLTASSTYPANTPFSTVTAYPLEAFVDYSTLTGDHRFTYLIPKMWDFFTHLPVMREDESCLATSYGPDRDFIVTNSVSYTMYAHALALPFLTEDKQSEARRKLARLYNFVRLQQRSDGSWLYSPEGLSFIDCFHSCIVLKNLIKTHGLVHLPESEVVTRLGYQYLIRHFRDNRTGLFKRFTLATKPSLVAFDLYDNAEMLNLCALRGDYALANDLAVAIDRWFCAEHVIYSQVDLLGKRRRANTLRWAVMPYLYALSALRVHSASPF